MVVDQLFRDLACKQPHPLVFATISGAHLYGFPSADSDYDLRGVHILPPRAVLGLNAENETIERSFVLTDQKTDPAATSATGGRRYRSAADRGVGRYGTGREFEIDLVTHDVRKFFLMLLKRNGYVLEQLYSPLIVHTTPEHAELKEIARGCITRHHAHHYLGFVRTQWGLFEKSPPPDRRIKPLLYVYRVLLTGIHLMRTGEVEANLLRLNEHYRLPYIGDLVAWKISGGEQGALRDADFDFHARECARLTAELEQARDASTLRDTPTLKSRAESNDLLLRLRGVP